MHGIGSQLRQVRLRLGLSLRDVEQRTAHLAQRAGVPGYRISASWLNRIEREGRELSGTKLITLACIYELTSEEIFALCPGIAGVREATPGTEHVSNMSTFTNGPML